MNESTRQACRPALTRPAEHLTQATVALDYEQRTANLIAWIVAPYVEGTPETLEAAKMIQERPGLA